MRRKRTERSKLIKHLDDTISLQVREANRGFCEICGGPANQVHHVVTRDNMRLRFDRRNLVSICNDCHLWAHGRRRGSRAGFLRFSAWFAARRPDDDAFLDEADHKKPIHRTISDLRDLRNQLAA